MSYPPPHQRHPSEQLAPVFVSVRAGSRSFVVFGDEQRRIAECDGDCEFWAWPGAYRVRLNQTEHEPETSVRLRIRHSGNYELSVGDSGTRDAGLALGIGGSALAVAGTVMLFAGALELDCANSPGGTNAADPGSCSTPPVVYYGLLTLGVGLGLGAGGFVLYAENQMGFGFKRELGLSPITARVGPVPMPHGGVGLGATLSF
jgi:hypothetical protein